MTGGLSRRRLGALLGGAAALGVAGGAGGAAVSRQTTPAVPFFGPNQAGITTPAQDRLHFAAFDLGPATTRQDLIDVLIAWTAAAARMTAGHDVGGGAVTGSAAAPPDDTGEALDLSPARLTLTVGFGAGLFDHRFGLAAARPGRADQRGARPEQRGDPCGARVASQGLRRPPARPQATATCRRPQARPTASTADAAARISGVRAALITA